MQNKLSLIGFASGIAGANLQCGKGPLVIQHSPFLSPFSNQLHWQAMLSPIEDPSLRLDEIISNLCTQLANETQVLTKAKQFFSVIGGDHSSAIGTWSGVCEALQKDIGLVWMDAHMDSHTPETTESGRIHGMPLASLMGYGYPSLTSILSDKPKLKPENICLIGVRSFEKGEAALLERLKVRIYWMEEVKQRGFMSVFQEAVEKVSRHTAGYGISLDLDSLDPDEVPGVDVRVPDGIKVNDIYQAFSQLITDPKWIGTEMTEFDPTCDRDHMTEKCIVKLLTIMMRRFL